MYVEPNFGTKKALKEAIARGDRVTVFQPNDMLGRTEAVNKLSESEPVIVTIEGPHAPRPHKWYGRAYVANGVVYEVR